jgi:hypothetical protein
MRLAKSTLRCSGGERHVVNLSQNQSAAQQNKRSDAQRQAVVGLMLTAKQAAWRQSTAIRSICHPVAALGLGARV